MRYIVFFGAIYCCVLFFGRILLRSMLARGVSAQVKHHAVQFEAAVVCYLCVQVCPNLQKRWGHVLTDRGGRVSGT
jgi:hypothetical protein